MELSITQWTAIEDYTLAQYPKEMCGIILKSTGEFVPLENSHETPESAFSILPEHFAKYLGDIAAVLHSHCTSKVQHEVFDLRTPSYKDIEMQKASGIPWGIVGCEGFTVSYPIWLPRKPKQKYLNRRFIWFIDDCYSLVQDYYLFELGIKLPDHKATEDFAQLRNFNNLFDAHILDYGFHQLSVDTKLEKGDLLLLDNAGGKRNHLGIYTGTGILHQSLISKEESLEHFVNKFHMVLRHENKII